MYLKQTMYEKKVHCFHFSKELTEKKKKQIVQMHWTIIGITVLLLWLSLNYVAIRSYCTYKRHTIHTALAGGILCILCMPFPFLGVIPPIVFQN